jgi:hypothetical protein
MRAAALLLLCAGLAAQEAAPPIEANPNRPSFANPARTTQDGVAELELGPQRTTNPDGSSAEYVPTLLKLGLAPTLELRLGWNGPLRLDDGAGHAVSGPSDPSLGIQWNFARDAAGFDWAVGETHKFATASVEKGLGTGRADDTLTLLASRDFGPVHLDLNVLRSWLGRPAPDAGREGQWAGAAAFGWSLDDHWGLGAELYGIQATGQNPRILSTLWNLAYKVNPQLVLDAGVDRGLTREAPNSVFVGLTWAMGRFKR